MEPLFSLRRDRNGLRPVFMLGNIYGRCPYDCKFCGVKASERIAPAEVLNRFHQLWDRYQPLLGEPYHPLIYNEGNVTNPLEFPKELLDYILQFFRGDPRVRYVSLNSRERDANDELLRELREQKYPFPIHFIFGMESSSPRAQPVLGKKTVGELDRFVDKLLAWGDRNKANRNRRTYCFGLDVNLVFLPELYLEEGESRAGQEERVQQGIRQDVNYVLDVADRGIPIQINIHPYHRVDDLPFADADLGTLIGALPCLQSIVDLHNARHPAHPVHLFIGIEGKGYATHYWRMQAEIWDEYITAYNATGLVPVKDRGHVS